jgi:hypothetical protein
MPNVVGKHEKKHECIFAYPFIAPVCPEGTVVQCECGRTWVSYTAPVRSHGWIWVTPIWRRETWFEQLKRRIRAI